MNAIHVPRHISNLYWHIKRGDEAWTTARDIVEAIWPRYAQAGLLPKSLTLSSMKDHSVSKKPAIAAGEVNAVKDVTQINLKHGATTSV
jgi:hypothetical protein